MSRHDLRYAFRQLVKNPGFTLVAVLTLALGIGANTAIFSIVNGLLLRSFPYPDADRLVYVWASNATARTNNSLSPHNFTDFRERTKSFESHFAFRYTSLALTGDGLPESLNAIAASADFGRVMGVAPQAGRLFGPDEDQPGRNRVAVISHGLWQRRFGGRPIVGQTIRINGEAYTTVGVMPEGFDFPNPSIDIWVPLALDLSTYVRGTSFLQSVARLKPGVTPEQAQAELLSVAGQIAKDNTLRDFGGKVTPLRKQVTGDVEKPLLILLATVLMVLLIACVNVANLMLGRATVRWKEMSVRTALGASRWDLIRLVLTESLVLGAIGGAVGLGLAGAGTDWLVKTNPDLFPNPKAIAFDPRVVGFTAVLSLLAGTVFGLAPAWRMAAINLNQALRDTGRSTSSRFGVMRNGLVVTEIALSLTLLVGAGLLLKSFWRLASVDPGFRATNVVSAHISLPRAKYATEQQQADFFKRLTENLAARPGIEAAAAATNLPFNNSRGATTFNIDGRPTPPNEDGPVADNHEVTPGYFATLGIPLRAGRDFTADDDVAHPGVVIINEEAARRFWPGENPLGKRLTIGMPEEEKLYGKAVSREIIGVIGNVKLLELQAGFRPEIYVSALQLPTPGMALAVRGRASVGDIGTAIREAVRDLDPNQPIRRIQALETQVARTIAPQKLLAALVLAFAGLAAFLAAIGIYGVMAHSVAQRTQEIGIRLALGARAGTVLRMVIGQGMRVAAVGLALGILGSFAVSRIIAGLLFEVSATDPTVFLVGAVALLAIVMLACWVPARRAARVDPMTALRSE